MKRKRLLLLTAAAVMVVILAVLYWMGSVLLTLGISMVICLRAPASGPTAGAGNALAPAPARPEPHHRHCPDLPCWTRRLYRGPDPGYTAHHPAGPQIRRELPRFLQFRPNNGGVVDCRVFRPSFARPPGPRRGDPGQRGRHPGRRRLECGDADSGHYLRLLRPGHRTGHRSGPDFLPDEGLRTDSILALCPLPIGPAPLLAGHYGHHKPDLGRLHPGSANPGPGGRGYRSRRAAAAGGAFRHNPGHRPRP